MPNDAEKLVLLFEAQNKDVLRKLNQIERASKSSFGNARTPLRKFNSDLQQTPKIGAKVQGFFQQAARSSAILQGPLGGVAGRFGAVGAALGSVNPLLLAGGVAMSAMGYAAAKSIPIFARYEKQQLVLQEVLKATGGSAGRTAGQIEALARDIGYNTLGSANEAREAAAQLLTFRSIAGDTFERTLRLSQDLATVGFGTLKSSTVQLGKALEDPKNGLSALRRVGVSFTQVQRDMINNFIDTGRTADAQNAILDAVEQQVGGAGAASGGGLSGAYDSLSEATQILLARWGSQIASAINLRGALLGIAGAIDEVNARAGLSGRIATVDSQISQSKEMVSQQIGAEGSSYKPFVVVQEEARLQGLLRQRGALLRELDRQRKEEDAAYVQGVAQQKAAERERIDAVVSGLTKEIDLTKKSSAEKRIAAELAKAGVVASSPEGQQIAALTRDLIAQEEATKAREKSAKAGGKQEESYKRVIEALHLEEAALGMTALQQKILNDLSAAGVSAESAKGQEIIRSNTAISQFNSNQERTAELAKFAGNQLVSAFSTLTAEISTGNAVLDQFIHALINAGLQAAFLNEGPFANLFGGGGGAAGGGAGIIGALGKVFGGFFAEGGYLGAGKVGIAGERGPEIIRGPANVTPLPANDNRRGGAVYAPTYNIDARGADQAAVARLEAGLQERDRRFGRDVATTNKRTQLRNLRAS